jgi:glutamate dehydrogenase
MEKYKFTMHHLYGESHNHITKILNILQASNLEEIFVRKFYATIPMSDLTDEEHVSYAQSVRNAFNFIQQYNSKSNVKIYQDTPKGAEEGHTIIEILCDEKPFIFDSAMCVLNRLNIEVEKVAHPNMFVRRDKQGQLLSIDECLQADGKQELIIQIKTCHTLDEELVQEVEQELHSILDLAHYAVYDWKATVDRLQNSTVHFSQYKEEMDQELYQEQKEFLERMKDKYFVFLGSVEYVFTADKEEVINGSALGILKLEVDQYHPLIKSTIFTSDFAEKKDFILIGKLNKVSSIHRDANIDYLCLKEFSEDGKLKKATIFFGLFTSILYYQSATLIPIIRGNLHKVLQKAGFDSHSYAGKELVSIIEALPRDELFQISADELYPLLMEIYALLFVPELRLFLRKKGHTLSCLLFLPLDLINADNIRRLKSALAFEYGPIVNHSFSQINDSKLCCYHFIIDTKESEINSDLTQIEKELKTITKSWEDGLNDLLFRELSKAQAKEMSSLFLQAFPMAYKENAIYSSIILEDIENILSVAENKELLFKIYPTVEGAVNVAQCKIYYTEEINLSSIMPMLQNMGFNVAAEQIYTITLPGGKEIWLHQFTLKVNEQETKMLALAKQNIEETFHAIHQEKCQDDSYNKLILRANLTHRQVTLLRALAGYLYQTKIGYSKEYIGQLLNKHSEIVKQLASLFYSMFMPKITLEDRKQQVEENRSLLEESLSLVHDNVEDQIIRRFIDLVNNILRTNYFLQDQNGQPKDYISLKVNSEEVLDLPLPRPYREIFVYSASFEAIHLRGGKVARGGLRWSDRTEDYRTEVLDLMKTQVVKNSVIVPTGSKGGFVLKNIVGLTRDELHAKAIESYKNFLRGLLDITDNLVDGKIQRSKQIVRQDGDDSYLVVAADKGTATFSDIANQISAEYNFWLDDAFASGGSKGYDHKKMGITAKGAWVSVVRHFHEMGINIDNTDFTVVGIGDMAGDVFGNGMLLSEHIRLVGAFNHMHIFIDPNPDSKTSFLERKRLFNLPRSSWLDYNSECLSKGAMIYERKAKILQLTPEIKALLNLSVDNITPNDLIKKLLVAEVDLLWNGGIGTYVKASFETQDQVGDKANDSLRCNGVDLRCKIIGEGGNLGLTQHARIEYAQNGGRINTDAIDNSAGVDCSDHEVNIKIALHQAMSQSLLDEDGRVALLESMTEDVSELSLKDNRTQTRALTIAEQQGHEILDLQEQFIDLLEEQGILDRKLECLPSKQKFTQLYATDQGLSRPELSVLLAYSKNAIYNNLIETSLSEEEYFYKELLLYFPEAMREQFAEIIANHPLRREIITTAITNSMVNRIDTFYLHLAVESGHKFCDIARAYTVTRDVFGLRDLWKEINTLDGLVPVKEQSELSIVVKKFVMRSTSWLLRNYAGKINISAVIEEYQEKINEISEIINSCAVGKYKENYDTDIEDFVAKGVPHKLACKISSLGLLSSGYNIAEVANKHKVSVKKASDIYFELGHRFSLDWLRHTANHLVAENNWQKLVIRGFKDELYDFHRRLTSHVVKHAERSEGGLEEWYNKNDKHIKLFDRFINEVKSQGSIEYAMIDLSLKKLGVLLSK